MNIWRRQPSGRIKSGNLSGVGGGFFEAPSGPTYTLDAASGSFSLAGQDAGLAVNRTLEAEGGAFALVGQDAGLVLHRVMPADSGSFSLDGQAATLTYTAATPVDVRVSWLQLDTAATPVDVRVSWLQLDTAATPVDVKVSWLQLDTSGFQSGKSLYQDTDQGVAGKNKPERNHYADWLNREYERKLRIQRDDALATEFIMALVQMELLDGTI